MSKYLKRAFGNYEPIDKLIAIEFIDLDAKNVPKC